MITCKNVILQRTLKKHTNCTSHRAGHHNAIWFEKAQIKQTVLREAKAAICWAWRQWNSDLGFSSSTCTDGVGKRSLVSKISILTGFTGFTSFAVTVAQAVGDRNLAMSWAIRAGLVKSLSQSRTCFENRGTNRITKLDGKPLVYSNYNLESFLYLQFFLRTDEIIGMPFVTYVKRAASN